MASTNHTPNLGLNQWEANDPVLREDFNADNAKIDAAAAMVRLGSITVPTDTQTITVDLTPCDPSRFHTILVELLLRSSPDTDNGDTVTCDFNSGENLYRKIDLRATTYTTTELSSLEEANCVSGSWFSAHQLRLIPTETGLLGTWEYTARVKTGSMGTTQHMKWGGCKFFCSTVAGSNLTRIVLTSQTRSFAAGCRYTVYGLLR